MASSIESLKAKAEKCLERKADMPMSPLFNMANAAVRNSKGDLKSLQDALDYLTCKAKAKMKFYSDEKEFLKEIYEALWWGGKWEGLDEAAKLANHYINNSGNNDKSNPLIINADVYKTSKIVIAAMNAMKMHIKDLHSQNKTFLLLNSSNIGFRSSSHAKPLYRMNFRTEGEMKQSGVLAGAQKNHRLHKTDPRFHLDAMSQLNTNGKMRTTWSVLSEYDFEPFESKDYYTEIPLGGSYLIIYDGLSEYMTKIGIANAFWHKAQWFETWSLDI